jgi:hypothetical protein
VQGKVTACNPVIEKRESSITTGNAFRTGIKFENVDGPTYDGLWSLTIDNIVSATYQEIEGKRSGESAEVTKLLKLPCSLRPRDYDEEGWTNLGILTAVDVKGFSMLTEPLDHFQGKSLAFKIETPLGSVSGEAELCGNPDEQRNASISRFDVKRFDGQGRGLVKKIGEIESRRSLRHLVEYSAESPKLPFSRTTVLVGAPSISLSISLVLLLLFYHPHHVTLAKIAHAKQPASTDLVKLDEMTSAALNGTFTDLALMVKLKNILHHVGRDEEALQVLERLTELNPKNSGLMLAKANAYRDLGLEERAFDATLALCLRFPGEQRPDAILSAVRSGIALERDKEALKLMAGLSQVELNSNVQAITSSLAIPIRRFPSSESSMVLRASRRECWPLRLTPQNGTGSLRWKCVGRWDKHFPIRVNCSLFGETVDSGLVIMLVRSNNTRAPFLYPPLVKRHCDAGPTRICRLAMPAGRWSLPNRLGWAAKLHQRGIR